MFTKNLISNNNKKLSYLLNNTFSTICIVAGSASGDLKASKIMRSIRENSKEEVNFVGIGGYVLF
jgi:hypothetical protein